MGYVKVVKNKAYFKRYQVKFRRRREAKTDYQQRQRLIIQDKNKYATPKYRFCVRVSNREITCQIFSADLTHDVCLAAAYSSELARYGVKAGFKNYAAAYATGLLLARRVNALFKLDYDGNTEITGEPYSVADDADESKAPFRCYLDVGLARTTTGARIFGALKGAVDGGLDIPHKDKRFPGNVNGEFDAGIHRDYIFGQHVARYMSELKDDEEAYKRQFGNFIAAGIGPDDMEGMYESAHAAIRADPFKKRDALEKGRFKTRQQPKGDKFKLHKYKKKLSIQQRKARIAQKLKARGVESIGPAIEA